MGSWSAWPIGLGWPLLLFALLFGIAWGGFTVSAQLVISDYFGLRAIGALTGLFYLSTGLATLTGPLAAGILYDFAGSYHLAMPLAGLVAAPAVLIVLRLPAAPSARSPQATAGPSSAPPVRRPASPSPGPTATP